MCVLCVSVCVRDDDDDEDSDDDDGVRPTEQVHLRKNASEQICLGKSTKKKAIHPTTLHNKPQTSTQTH